MNVRSMHAACGMMVSVLIIAAGCADQPTAPVTNESAEAGSALGEEVVVISEQPVDESHGDPPTAVEAETPEMPSEPAGPSDAALSAPLTAPQADSSPARLPSEVTLGDPSLTSGIPGTGALTTDQITAWLARPGVHDTLKISLPLGLNTGGSDIKGIDENPLTRAKIELGRQLYFDTRLSSDNSISCASCHDPQQGFAAQTQFGVGVNGQTGNRNSPTSYNRILSDVQFWDGRAASLEEQAVGPIANPIEMANTHEDCVANIGEIEGYRLQFEAVFGPDSVNIENVGRAIASFERAIVTGPSPFDYYAEVKKFRDNFGEEDLVALKDDNPELFAEYEQALANSESHPISESAQRGMELFFSDKAACSACHVGANLTDEKFHNLGVGMDAPEPDLGRFVVTGEEKDRGAFKTPTIRNVALTPPYMHDGSQKTLEEVVEWYAKGGHPNPQLDEKIKKLELSDQDKQDLVAFMRACTGAFPAIETGRLPE